MPGPLAQSPTLAKNEAIARRIASGRPVVLYPERTIVTSGLSKSLALGGWRIGFVRLPPGSLGERLAPALLGLASEVWSSLASPMQAVAASALDEPAELAAHPAARRRLHSTVTRELHRILVAAGASCRPPAGAF